MKILSNKVIWSNLGQSIGVFGGTFDPIQRAHIAIAQRALESNIVDSVVFVPARKNPLKLAVPSASDEDRIEMLSLALANISHTYISSIELDTESLNSYTVDSIEALHAMNSNCNFYFIAGSDQVVTLHRWQRVHDLLRLLKGFLVFPRKEKISDLLAGQKGNFSEVELSKFIPLELEASLQEVSATQVRTLVRAGKSLLELVPSEVDDFIKKKKLYNLSCE